jgi:3-hydroxyacyl-CoA dehydrogenase
LLEGKTVAPNKAQAAGIIDQVDEDPMKAAHEWVLNATEGDLVKPWDQKGYKIPGGTPYTPNGFMTFVGASAMINGKTQGAFPAAKALLSAVYEGALVPFDLALKVEARWFTNVIMNPSSSAMIRSLFINKSALEKGAVRPKDIGDQSVKKLGVLGAGMMGAGIALVSAQAGIEVILIDQTQEAADKGKNFAETHLDKGIKLGKTSQEQKESVLSNILPTNDLQLLSKVDLIVEAVFEDPKIKAEITQKVEGIIPKNCIFASNTSTLP